MKKNITLAIVSMVMFCLAIGFTSFAEQNSAVAEAEISTEAADGNAKSDDVKDAVADDKHFTRPTRAPKETEAPKETTAAETTVAETTVAETTATETTAAETTAAETTVAETTVAETTVAETTAVETTAVETTAVETTAVETTAVETIEHTPAAPRHERGGVTLHPGVDYVNHPETESPETLTELPEESIADTVVSEIPEDVPMHVVPKTGESSPISMILGIVLVGAAVAFGIAYAAKQKMINNI